MNCSICGRLPTAEANYAWMPGDTCSPECARTKAIVDAINNLAWKIEYEVEPPTTTFEEAVDGANRWAARQSAERPQ